MSEKQPNQAGLPEAFPQCLFPYQQRPSNKIWKTATQTKEFEHINFGERLKELVVLNLE